MRSLRIIPVSFSHLTCSARVDKYRRRLAVPAGLRRAAVSMQAYADRALHLVVDLPEQPGDDRRSTEARSEEAE